MSFCNITHTENDDRSPCCGKAVSHEEHGDYCIGCNARIIQLEKKE